MSRLNRMKAFFFKHNQKVVNIVGVVIVYFSTFNASRTGRKLEAQKIELDNVQQEYSYLKDSLQADTWLQSVGSKLDKAKSDRAKLLKEELLAIIEKSKADLINEEIAENKKNSAAGKSKSDDKMLNGILNGIGSSNGGRMM
mmetsp:Transcript_13028/g.12633  ORF Transcript_13028/g.12633 Transcript_13028/m.12633 type:complete len:142 (-) Transcript_13028:115-540(-)